MGRKSSIAENKYQREKMKSFREFLTEELISPSTIPGTISCWHGGRLDDAYNETIAHKKGRYEYGPGLYLSTSYNAVEKYHKGSRRLYLITIEKGNDTNNTDIPVDVILEWINHYVIRSKRFEVLDAIQRRTENGKFNAQIFINILINNDAIKSTDTGSLRKFLVNQHVDYSEVHNAFGWGETMIVLFNMRKIIDKKVVTPKDKIETYDLPTEWN